MLGATSWRGAEVLATATAFAAAAWLIGASPAQAYKVQITESGASVRWHVPAVTLRIDPHLEDYFGDMPIAKLVSGAAEAWSGRDGVPELLISRGEPGVIGFREEDATSNGVYLVEDWQLWPDALAATVATFESKSGRLVDADVQVNADFSFALLKPGGKAPDRYDMLSVMTHEMGHVLGLGDANDVKGATMWPTIAPGDTYQRDLDKDDEQGVEQAYAGPLSFDTLGGGCGGASVFWPRATGVRGCGLLILTAVLLAFWCLCRMRHKGGQAIALGAVLLFGGAFSPAPTSPPREAAGPAGVPAEAYLPREDPRARKRLAVFVHGAERIIKGRALSRGAELRGALIWTRFRVQGVFGAVELACPGGSLHGMTQVVSGRAPPREGELLVVAQKRRGPHDWAHFRDGYVYGGSLGDGPALEWD
jgi:hypothetical protein